MPSKPKKRRWVYVCNPKVYGIACDKCSGPNIEWSEFRGLIWCYDCKVDTPGTSGVFDGPIPINAAHLLGMCFKRVSLKTQRVIREKKGLRCCA